MRIGRLVARRCIASFAVLLLAIALADPYATVVAPPADFVADPMCDLESPLLGATVPDAAMVPVPAYPGSIFAGATPPYEGAANGMPYDTLPSVHILAYDPIDEVAAFYANQLGSGWSEFDVFGTRVFYLGEPVDDPLSMLFERPGAIPVVEIGEPFFACDLKLDSTAATAVTVYYQPR